MNPADHIETVRLELVRPGPSHGQLLSPLTPYLALCGDESPVTLRIDLEHWRLLNRLERLRYATADSASIAAVPNSARESELEELGRDIGDILAAIPTLGRELGRAAGQGSTLVHLELVISGSELSLLPYELLVSPPGYPGSGRALLLQPQTPIVITRQTRRGQDARDMQWNRTPRILFVSAAPGAMQVPVREHVQALRAVLEPWIEWDDDPKERLSAVGKHLTILPNASIEAITRACADGDYTHVHILAHGGAYHESGQTRYGLVLCDDNEPSKPQVIGGATFAAALHVKLASAAQCSRPVVVSLATCDAGNVGSVIAPGSSIAHDLHVHEVPWVFASQFPLTKRGSVGFVRELYKGLLWGEDPRQLLAHLRHDLHIARRNDHDWASLVAYASTPATLDRQVQLFRSKQHQRAADTDLARADYLRAKARDSGDDDDAKLHNDKSDAALECARARIAGWKGQLADGDDQASRAARVECLGVEGATEKKVAQLFFDSARPDQATTALTRSLAAYRDALRAKPDHHWTATQYLCLTAVLEKEADMERWVGAWSAARSAVDTQSGLDQAWAHGTLAELELLREYHWQQSSTVDEIVAVVEKHCDRIIELVGWDHFAVFSTRRQFERYTKWWWRDRREEPVACIAQAAVGRLTRAGG